MNFMSLFQSEAEQIQKIDAAAENAAKEAESEKPSAFVISEDEIDRMLLCPFQYFGVTDTVDLDSLKWSAGGYQKSELEHIYTFSGAIAFES